MSNKLTEIYCSINKGIETVYVFPDIKSSSKYNPYLKLLYNELLSQSEEGNSIRCTSPHPLFPLFIMKRIFGEKSIVHYHWLHFFNITSLLIVLWKLCLLIMYKFAGGKIVWTVHNKYPHVKKYLNLNFTFRKLLAKMAVRIHVHCTGAISIMAPILNVPQDKFFVVNHPYYPITLVDKKAAVNYLNQNMNIILNPSKPIFLMYGAIAHYKGIINVIKLFIENNNQLIIAGTGKKGEEQYLKEIEVLLQGLQSIFLLHHFVSQEEEKHLFNAVDCVIFNFEEILSSGSVMLALSYKKDIIIPNIGCLKELLKPNVYKFNSQSKLKNQIDAVAAKIKDRQL